MNRLQTIFNKLRVVIPVIHAINEHQVGVQAELASACGADGVLLINQGGMDALKMVKFAGVLSKRHAMRIGINLLGVKADFAVGAALAQGLHMLWSDDRSILAGQAFTEVEHTDGVPRLYFGGVAFKGQHDADLDDRSAALSAMHEARLGLDVVTTSGPGTGHATPRSKVKAMRFCLGDHPLACASGVSIDNVPGLLPYVDAFIVASSVERDFGYFDKQKLRALIEYVHTYGEALEKMPLSLFNAVGEAEEVADMLQFAAGFDGASTIDGRAALVWAEKVLRQRVRSDSKGFGAPPPWFEMPSQRVIGYERKRREHRHSYDASPCEACAENMNRSAERGCRFNPDNANGAGDQ